MIVKLEASGEQVIGQRQMLDIRVRVYMGCYGIVNGYIQIGSAGRSVRQPIIPAWQCSGLQPVRVVAGSCRDAIGDRGFPERDASRALSGGVPDGVQVPD